MSTKTPCTSRVEELANFFGEFIPSRPKVHPGHDWSRPPFFGPGTGRAEKNSATLWAKGGDMMRSCRSSSWFCHSCFNAKNIQKQVKVEKTIIKHPFGNGSHHLFMMIWGMVYIIVLPLLNADFMKLRLQVSTPLFFFLQPAQVSARETATPPPPPPRVGGSRLGEGGSV